MPTTRHNGAKAFETGRRHHRLKSDFHPWVQLLSDEKWDHESQRRASVSHPVKKGSMVFVKVVTLPTVPVVL